MELLKPLDDVSDWMTLFPKKDRESAAPQQLDDNVQVVAKLVGRQNVSYEPVWEAAERCYPKWLPVRCNSYRRAILLASSAAQHRTKAFEVKRVGRLVCVRLIPTEANQSLAHAG